MYRWIHIRSSSRGVFLNRFWCTCESEIKRVKNFRFLFHFSHGIHFTISLVVEPWKGLVTTHTFRSAAIYLLAPSIKEWFTAFKVNLSFKTVFWHHNYVVQSMKCLRVFISLPGIVAKVSSKPTGGHFANHRHDLFVGFFLQNLTDPDSSALIWRFVNSFCVPGRKIINKQTAKLLLILLFNSHLSLLDDIVQDSIWNVTQKFLNIFFFCYRHFQILF